MSDSGNGGIYPPYRKQQYDNNSLSRLKKNFSNLNALGVATNALLDAFMSFLEFNKRFLYPPLDLHPSIIFKTGMHAVLYTKVAQTAGIAAFSGMGYAGISMYKEGVNRSNSLTMLGNSFFLAESFMFSRAMFFAHDIHRFHRFGMLGAGLGGVADGIKATNYLLDKEYKKAAMYGALSVGNFGMMIFANHHRGAIQSTLWQGFKRMPPHYFLMTGFAIWCSKYL